MMAQRLEEAHEEIERLRQAIERLTRVNKTPAAWGLTPTQISLFGALMVADVVSTGDLFEACFADREDGGPCVNALHQHVMRMRRKLLPHGIDLVNHHGIVIYGHVITPRTIDYLSFHCFHVFLINC